MLWSTFLIRFAKHLALLVSLLILGRAARQVEVSEAILLALAAGSALLHVVARTLQQRPPRIAPAQHDPRAPET